MSEMILPALDQLTDAQLTMVKLARAKGVRHTRYALADDPTLATVDRYPDSHASPCVACKKSFDGPPIFVPIAYVRERNIWTLDPYACCNRPVCGKYYMLTNSSATFAMRCTLYKEFLAEFFDYHDLVPYVNVGLVGDYDGARVAHVDVQRPPFTFINTWLSETDIVKCDQKRQQEFDKRHTLKASKQQQAAYIEKLETFKKNRRENDVARGTKRLHPEL